MDLASVNYSLLSVYVSTVLLIAVIILILISKKNTEKLKESFDEQIDRMKQDTNTITATYISGMTNTLLQSQSINNDTQIAQLETINKSISNSSLMEEQKLDNIRQTVESRLASMQATNDEKLEQMRITVDEKLQQTLEGKLAQSFKIVSDQLEQVHKGLGDMQNLANGVGDLKKVLSNVKTKGILGEIQLGAILKDILASNQYEENVATVPGSSNRVEFAIKLPSEDDSTIYLPIDSKFPTEPYLALQKAIEEGNKQAIEEARKTLETTLRKEAKDIHDKYTWVPYTTEFAIMFLPTEGLYSEVCNMGLMEKLQREYKVSVAGPSTMAALLNSLQMGFKTLAIQQRSSEVWNLLSSVKTEFETFETVLASAQKKLQQTSDDLDKLVGARTRAINRKLKDIQSNNRQLEQYFEVEDNEEEE